MKVFITSTFLIFSFLFAQADSVSNTDPQSPEVKDSIELHCAIGELGRCFVSEHWGDLCIDFIEFSSRVTRGAFSFRANDDKGPSMIRSASFYHAETLKITDSEIYGSWKETSYQINLALGTKPDDWLYEGSFTFEGHPFGISCRKGTFYGPLEPAIKIKK